MPQRFGSAHTSNKLDKLERYLTTYSTALKNQDFRLIFFDAFAGTGQIQVSEAAPLLESITEYGPFIIGSTERALQLGKAFDEYIFVERSAQKVQRLAELKKKYPNVADRVSIAQGDANSELQRFALQTDWRKCRAVVFLDPFGNDVEWRTIEAIALTKAVDLWYLFPAGLGVHRQIGRDGTIHYTHGPSLDRMLGTTEWRTAFVEEVVEPDLFAGTRKRTTKVATPRSVTEFMIKRMRTIFGGGVLDIWLPLGHRNIHMYSLIFAWANPGEKAKLAGKLAEAVLRAKERGRFK